MPDTSETNSLEKSEATPPEVAETLLEANRRLNAVTLVSAISIALVSLCMLFWTRVAWLQVLAVVFLLGTIPVGVFAAMFSFQPRLAVTDTELLVYLQKNLRQPFRVPLNVVEVFFIGQGAVRGEEPGQPHGYQGAVAANVIVRIAESATDWHHRDVHLLLGVWNDGYITIRGLFSSNIDQEVMKVMNRKLLERKRKLRVSEEHSA